MTTLADVNNSIQNMVDQQESTNDSLQSLVAKISAEGEAAERQRLKDTKKSPVERPVAGKPPRSFVGGLAEGTGLGGLSGILGSMLKGVGFGGGLLGGATLGGLFGRAVGKLFFPAVGAFFGVKYLDKWLDPLMDKILGDDKTWTMFGKEIDSSKIVSGFAGALGVMFGPKLIKGAVFSLFEKDATTKGPALRQKFLRRLGLSSILLAAGGFAGDWLQDKGAPEGMANAVGAGLIAAGIGLQFFGVKGMIIGAIAGIAYEGLKQLTTYLNSKRAERVSAHLSEAMRELEVAETAEGIKKVQPVLDAKLQIMKAEAAAAKITDKEQKRAAEEAALMLRKRYRSNLTVAAQEEKETVPTGQQLLNPELAKEVAKENMEGNVSALAIENHLRNTVDLTPDDIESMGPDNYRAYLEAEVADAPFKGVKTDEAVQTAVEAMINPPELLPTKEPAAVTKAKESVSVRRLANQVNARVSSSRARGEKELHIVPGDEFNALDAFTVDNPVALPPAKINVSPKASSDLVTPNTAAIMKADFENQNTAAGAAGGPVIDASNNSTSSVNNAQGIVMPMNLPVDVLDAGFAMFSDRRGPR